MEYPELWTDEKLYKKYNLTAEEIAFIESMVRPMDQKIKNSALFEKRKKGKVA